MAGRHLVGLFGNFWHRCHHCLIVRTQNNQARGVGLDMVALSRILPCAGRVSAFGYTASFNSLAGRNAISPPLLISTTSPVFKFRPL